MVPAFRDVEKNYACIRFIRAYHSSLRARPVAVEARPPRNADGVVVLTGGSSRVSDAVDLLSAGYGRRLLISGVHPTNGYSDIQRTLPDNQRLIAAHM